MVHDDMTEFTWIAIQTVTSVMICISLGILIGIKFMHYYFNHYNENNLGFPVIGLIFGYIGGAIGIIIGLIISYPIMHNI